MMSSFHEDTEMITPVGENLNQSNFRPVFSPVSLLCKSTLNSPHTLCEIDLSTPHGDASAKLIPKAESTEFEQLIATPEIQQQIEPEQEDTTASSSSDNNNEEDSLRFALLLQYQEEEELIQMQQTNLRAVIMAGGLSGDDIGSMHMMMTDLQHQLQMIRASIAALNEPSHPQNSTDGAEDDRSFVDSDAGDHDANLDPANEGDEEGEENEEEEGEEQWDYEQLLQLGQRLGDVKTERWRLRAQSVIDALPTTSFAEACQIRKGLLVDSNCDAEVINLAEDSAIVDLLNDSQESVQSVTKETPDGESLKKAKLSHNQTPSMNGKQSASQQETASPSEGEYCIVCMEPYIAEDMVKTLPCKHFFHCHCTQGWLVDHNSCPYCKSKITATP